MKKYSKAPHIVVVDKDAEVQELISAFFKPKEYRVTVFSSAIEAIHAAQETTASDWDVLLSDLHLEDMTANDFTEKLNRILPDLPIVLITVPTSVDTAVEVIEKGAFNFITKPILFQALLISVNNAIRHKNLNIDNTILRNEISKNLNPSLKILGRSPRFLEALDIAKRVAKSSSNIFIRGESGTGKEVFARFIHDESSCSGGEFIGINCSAIPENLLESELFGHAKGSFTGASDKKIGLFEAAQNGTLFLDEIGDLSLSLQAKLLRVLQERKIRRVGENVYRPINCRVISATHKDLAHEIDIGLFREDLYFRLCVIPLTIPPLRDRPEDIILLAESFLRKFASINHSIARSFSICAKKFLLENPWRGNVRELENAVERTVVLATNFEITAKDFEFSIYLKPLKHEDVQSNFQGSNNFTIYFEDKLPVIEEVIQKYIEFAVLRNDGAKDRTAKDLGIDRKTLYKRMKEPLSKSHSMIE